MAKIDPYNHKEKYFKWKKENQGAIPGITELNSNLLKQYLTDMETGLNVSSSSKKGARSYIRLNALRYRVLKLIREFETRFGLASMVDITETQIHSFFMGMRNGTIKRADGKEFIAVKNYVKDFKAFWHWWMKVNRKKKIEIVDLTIDLDTSGDKPKWVYLTEEEVKRLSENATQKYRVLIWFLFDSGIRSPTELMNLKVSDFYNDFKELNIRDEISKTFGRKIKLMICSQMLKEYVKTNKIPDDSCPFKISPGMVNRYFNNLGKRILGDKLSPAGQKYSDLTMYDFRHCSCCYWLPRYKSESALKYRFGWKKSDKIHYYSELLGMKDTITEDDLLIDLTKTEIEKKLELSERERVIMQERLKMMELDLKRVMEIAQKFERVIQISIKNH